MLNSKTLAQGLSVLVIRQALGTAISSIGVLALARLIGPLEYGLYASGLAIFLYLHMVLRLGVCPYLIADSEEPKAETIANAVTLVLVLAVGGALLVAVAIILLARLIDLGRFELVLLAMLPALLIQSLYLVPTVLLERALSYKRVAVGEAVAQISQVIVAVCVATIYPNVWAPVAGFYVSILLLVACLAGFQPRAFRLGWNVRAMVTLAINSLPFAGTDWILQLRNLVNPLVVGSVLGPAAVGIVAFSLRLVSIIGFVREIGRRVAFSGMRHLQGDRIQLGRFVEQTTSPQILLIGLPLVAFSIALPALIKYGLGAHWIGIEPIFPLIAAGYVVNSSSGIASSALAILRMNRIVIGIAAVQSIFLLLVAVLLASRLGIVGYGLAEIVASLWSTVILIAAHRAFRAPRPRSVALVVTVVAVGMSWRYIGFWAFVPMPLLLGVPSIRRALMSIPGPTRLYANNHR